MVRTKVDSSLLLQPIEYVRNPLGQIRKKLENPSAKKRWSKSELGEMQSKIDAALSRK